MQRMRFLSLFLFVLVKVVASTSVGADGLPDLLVIKNHTFPLPWGCGSYDQASLWLSNFSKKMNSPDLLYNSCVSCSATCSQTFSVNTVVWDSSAIAKFPQGTDLTTLSASTLIAFDWARAPMWETSGWVSVAVGATYGVIIAKENIRSIYAFQVVNASVNGPVTINYGVFSYELMQVVKESPGSSWSARLHN